MDKMNKEQTSESEAYKLDMRVLVLMGYEEQTSTTCSNCHHSSTELICRLNPALHIKVAINGRCNFHRY